MGSIDFKPWFLHPETLPAFQGGVVAMGAFDGCHLGHQQLLSRADAAISFVPSPKSFFDVEEKVLTLPEEKLIRFPHFVFMRFDEQLAGMTPETFIDVINAALKPKKILVGWDFHFGKKLSGNVTDLKIIAAKLGIEVEIIPPFKLGHTIVKSRDIREHLRTGHIEKANKFLGYDYFICAKVVHGKALGRTIGFPTINLDVHHQKLTPKPGVYAGVVEIDGVAHPTAISVKMEDKIIVEGHILDFKKDVYGKPVRMVFSHAIREQRHFDTFEHLKEQIQKDLSVIRQRLMI